MGATDSGTRLTSPAPLIVESTGTKGNWLRRHARRVQSPVLKPVLQGLAAWAVYEVVFVAVFGRPLFAHPGVPQVRQDWTDPNFYTWAMQWWPYALTHGLNPLYSTQLGAPSGYSLAWATTTPSVALLMWPVTAALGIIRSYNIMLLTVPPVSAWAAFVLARRLTGRFWPALAGGAVYGFSAFEFWHSLQGQPNLTVIGLFPLMVYLMLRWWEGTLQDGWFLAWLAVLMAVQFYTFNEAFADMTIVGAGVLAIGYAVAGRASRRVVARLAVRVGAAYVIAIVLAAPYLYYALKHYPSALVRQWPGFSLGPVRLVLPSSDRLFGIAPLVSASEHIGRYSIDDYVGVGLLAVLAALAVRTWRSSRLTRLLVLAFAFVIALALGPGVTVGTHQRFPLPWGVLWHLPLLRSAEPSRLIIFAYLILALALAQWLGKREPGSRRRAAARWALGIFALAIVFADLPTFSAATPPIPLGVTVPAGMRPTDQLPEFLTAGLYRRYLTPGETVVVVTRRGNAGMLFQADADFYFRIAGGFINTSLTRQDALPAQVEALTDPTGAHIDSFRRYVEHNHIGAILVEQRWAESWMSVFGRTGLHAASVGGVTVYSAAHLGPWSPPRAVPGKRKPVYAAVFQADTRSSRFVV